MNAKKKPKITFTNLNSKTDVDVVNVVDVDDDIVVDAYAVD